MRESEFTQSTNAVLAAYKVPREKIAAEMDAVNEKFRAYGNDKSIFKSRAEYYRTLLTWFVLFYREKAEAEAA